MGKALADNAAQVGVFDVDWSQWKAVSSKAAESSFYREVQKSLTGKADHTRLALLREILGHDGQQQQEIAVQLIQREIAKILRLPADKLDTAESLTNLGVDSMMTTELTLRLQEEFGLELTMAEVLKGPSIQQLAERLRAELSHFIVANADILIDQLDEVHEDEIDRMCEVLATVAT
jgi:acyl carrier protein